MRFSLLSLLLLLFLGNPEFHQKRFGSKHSRLIIGLDGLLSTLDCVVKDISILIWLYLLIVNLLNISVELDWNNVWVFHWECFSKLLLSDLVRDELNVDVRVEGLRKILSDWVYAGTLSRLVILLADVLVNNQKLIFRDLLLVHLKNGSLSMFGVLKTDVTVVLKVALFIALDSDGFDVAKLGKHFLELCVFSALG